MPPGDYTQEKVMKQEEKLIARLEQLELDRDLVDVVQFQAGRLLDGRFNVILLCKYSLVIH